MSVPRVLFLTYHLPDDGDVGAFRPWMELRLLRDLGCEVTVITSSTNYMTGAPARGSPSERDVRVYRIPGLRDHRRSLIRRALHYVIYAAGSFLVAIFVAGRPTVVFIATDPFPLVPLASLLATLKRARLVIDERDLYPETAVALGVLKEGWMTRVLARFARRLRRRADHILVATPSQYQRLREREGIPVSRLSLLPNADVYLATDAPKGQPRVDIQDLPMLPSHIRCWAVYAGGFGQANDLGLILDAFTLLADHPDVGLLLIGTGEKKTLIEDARARGAHVHTVGAMPRWACRALLSRASLGLHAYVPNRFFSEALPSKVYDYLAAGCPVLFAGTGDTANLLLQSGAGCSVPPGDVQAFARELRRLLVERPDSLRSMAIAARRWYTEHVSYRETRDAIGRVFVPLWSPASSCHP